MPRIHRAVGDQGAKARITVTDVKDANGESVTVGTLTLRAQGLFEGDMSHQGDGTWTYDPVAGDISKRGIFVLDVFSVDGGQVSIPSDNPWTLSVRDQVSGT